jgi:hypothetical protein
VEWVSVGEQNASRAAAMEMQARAPLSRVCPMKHVLAVLVIAALVAAAASGQAQVQQGAPPPSTPPADTRGAAAPPDTLLPAVAPAHSVRRAPNKHASRSSDRVANELNRQELNRIASGSRPAYGPSVAAAPTYAPPSPWYPPPWPYLWPYRPVPWYPPPMWYPPSPW